MDETDESAPASETAPAAEEEKERRPLAEADWANIVSAWELGEVASLDELAKRFGAAKSTLAGGLKKRGAVKGSRAGELKEKMVAAKLEAAGEAAKTFEEQRQARIEEQRNKYYQQATFLRDMVVATVARAKKDGLTPAAVNADLVALKHAINAVEKSRETIWGVLKPDELVDEAALPNLPIMELTEQKLDEMQNAQQDELEDLEVETPELEGEVVIEDGEPGA